MCILFYFNMFSKCIIWCITYYTNIYFQIALRGRGDFSRRRGMGNFGTRNFFMSWRESDEEWFWSSEPFSKLKTTFCKYWTSIKIKISMTYVHKEYGTWTMTTAKKNWWGESTGGYFSWCGMNQFSASEGTPPHPSTYRQNSVTVTCSTSKYIILYII